MALSRKPRRDVFKSIIEFAGSLLTDIIGSDDLQTTDHKIGTLGRFIDTTSDITLVPQPPTAEELDGLGTKLWNACTRAMRREGLDEGIVKFLSRARAFAFLVLECATGCQNSGTPDDIRLLRTALKSARSCLALDQLDDGLKILEKAALRENKLSKESDNVDEILKTLSAEYYISRVNLAWKQGRLDIAEHMLSKIDLDNILLDSILIQRYSDLLFDIGKSLNKKNEHSEAVKWLERSLYAFSQKAINELYPDAGELKLCVLHELIQTYCALKTEDSKQNATELLSTLEREYGHRLEVLRLSFEVIYLQGHPDSQRYYDRLCSFINIAPATELNFKDMLCYVHRLRELDKDLAISSLEQLLLQRLFIYGNTDLIERGFVTYIWMKTTTEPDGGFKHLELFVEKSTEIWKSKLSGEATHACLILLWKKVTTAFDRKEYENARNWCQLALHPLFENSGESNRSKIGRKLILCALESKATDTARRLFSGLSEACKSEILTRYLMYRVALQDEDLDLAQDCLDIICKSDTEKSTYLLACIAEALHHGAERQAVIVIQRLLDKLDGKQLPDVHFPALLRCTGRLLISELYKDDPHKVVLEDQICRIFECLSAAVNRETLSMEQLSIPELEWFSRNSYNLALQCCTKWELPNILRLLAACINVIHLYPTNLGEEAEADVEQRKLSCYYLSAILTIAQARLHKDREIQQAFYLDSRIHIQGFRTAISPLLKRNMIDSLSDYIEKYRTLLAFDFEAAVTLDQWSSLAEILKEARNIADARLYSLFADIILSSGESYKEALAIFQEIIHVTRQKDIQNIAKISRWLRCLFQLSVKSNIVAAESVMDEAYALARDIPGYQSSGDDIILEQANRPSSQSVYPEEELEWLSTSAFNYAIDFYLASDDTASRRWYTKALDLARLLQDNGSLWRTFQANYARLNWED
ncbi:sporulation-specific protein 22 [Ophidiomyces ophidiicola]|nr:sporulation-specific protein 22 [Ophidiomyces ophidiicola]